MTGTFPEREEGTARQVEQLRHEHPGWSVWYGRKMIGGVETYKYQAQPKNTEAPETVIADTADGLRGAIAERGDQP